ncbi:MAG: AgmX/PglI C-terminal domain-containing protein [Deltaproteobacteria bacterium]|nr:AgmX/PglI C-terminal domain-containing protein [Deltaproteobacteria bacterium]
MFTDIKGYSALMGRDEPLALSLLEEHNAILVPVIERHGGEIIKFIGDAILAIFESARDGVRAAVEGQRALAERNRELPEERRILVRMGLHVGDVSLRDGDAFGDGVNIASRLEPLADPGGLCVSQTVRDMVAAHPEFVLESMGQRTLKNIQHPVELYRVRIEPGLSAPSPAAPRSGPRSRAWGVAAALAVVAVGVLLTILGREPGTTAAPAPSPREELRQVLADRAGTMRIGLIPLEPVGTEASLARAMGMHLQGRLAELPNAEVRVVPSTEAAGEGAHVIRGAVGALGSKLMLNLERVDGAEGVVSRVYRDADDLDALVASVDEALLDLLVRKVPEPSSETMVRIIRERLGEVRNCYEKILADHPDAEGKLTVEWGVAPSGRTRDVTIAEDEIGVPELDRCVREAMGRWLFPATAKGLGKVRYPLSFASSADD